MRILFINLVVVTSLVSSAQHPFSINGIAPQTFNNKKIYLTIEDNYSSKKYKRTDSTTVQNGRFFFNGTINKIAEKATLSAKAKDISGFFYFVVDSGANTMVVKPLPPKWPLFKNKLSYSEVVNSPSNRIKKAIDSLINHYYLTKGKPSPTNKYLIELDAPNRAELRRKQMEVLKQNPSTFYTVVHLYSELHTAGGLRAEEVGEVYDALDKELQTSSLGMEINELVAIARSTQIGKPVPQFSVKTNTDSSFSNSALKGSVYLLAFGATWCGPCKERMPVLNQLYEKYKANGFQVVYINLDEKTQLWKEQIIKYKMNNWINVSEGVKWNESDLAKRFNVSAVPYYLLVDKEGKIVYNPFQLGDYEYEKLEEAIVKSSR